MSEVLELSDADFAKQMHGLVSEAARAVEDRSLALKQAQEAREAERHVQERAMKAYQSLPEMLRPILVGLQAVGRATGENGHILSKLDKATTDSQEARSELPSIVGDLKAMLEQRNAVSRQMFDALHQELKSYKDGFLLDSVHRPMIRDLITLYDDVSHIRQQVAELVTMFNVAAESPSFNVLAERLQSMELHMEHNLDFILEVLARLEVTMMPSVKGKLDKKTQRAVAVEVAEDPDEDLDVVRCVKRGFFWNERVMRAEEVVIKKWKEGFLVALQSPTA